ncbi:hypothetical protein TNCV_3822051 [Trichonephila clavipes]|nr:hypothetical protein TNCV_3822051 [Trichonephila clavipes]
MPNTHRSRKFLRQFILLVFSNSVFKPWVVLGRELGVAIALHRASQSCCIRLKSRDLVGQSSEYPHFPEICWPDELYVASRCHPL